MKITIVTTLPRLSENKRIGEECEALGHKFELIDLKDFAFGVEGGRLKFSKFEGLSADIVILRGVFLAIKTISVIVNSLRERGVKIFDNNFLEHRYAIDKVTDFVKLTLKGVPVPDTYYSRDFTDYPKFAKKLGFPLVIKSSRTGKGVGVFKIEGRDGFSSFISEAEAQGKTAKSYLLQKFIDYEYDLRTLIIGEQVFTMRRIPAEGEFRANFSLGGRVEAFNLDNEGKKLAQVALDAVNMSVGGVDILIRKDNKRYILEVNHTAGFVGMEKATGKNIGKVYVEHAISHAR